MYSYSRAWNFNIFGFREKRLPPQELSIVCVYYWKLGLWWVAEPRSDQKSRFSGIQSADSDLPGLGSRDFWSISSFGGQTWTSMIIPQILDIWLLRRPVLVMEIDEGDLPDTIPFYRIKIGPLFMKWHPFAC